MPRPSTLVSIGLPVYNGVQTLEAVVKAVLAQDHEQLELVISDNASTDATEDLCRELAARDDRIAYYRNPENVGVLNNYVRAMQLAKGTYFRWISDDDWLAPNCISRCLEAFAEDGRLILVTTQLDYVRPDTGVSTVTYSDRAFYSDDPIERFERFISYLIDDSLPIDPLYALAKKDSLASIRRRNVIREDEVYAANLALAGPWGHVPETLGRRNIRIRGYGLAQYTGVPTWQAYIPTTVQCADMIRSLHIERLTSPQRRRVLIAVARMFVFRHHRTLTRRARRLANIVWRSHAQ